MDVVAVAVLHDDYYWQYDQPVVAPLPLKLAMTTTLMTTMTMVVNQHIPFGLLGRPKRMTNPKGKSLTNHPPLMTKIIPRPLLK